MCMAQADLRQKLLLWFISKIRGGATLIVPVFPVSDAVRKESKPLVHAFCVLRSRSGYEVGGHRGE